jgi:hypothetical protein
MMSDSHIGMGIRVGAVAAATTVGAVIGLGLRHGLALRPFMSAGRALLDKLQVAGSARSTIVAGLAMAIIALIVLGVCFTVVAGSLRGLRLLAAAIGFAILAWATTVFIVPSILVLTDDVVLGTAQRVFVFAMLSLALVVGMRLARSDSRIE